MDLKKLKIDQLRKMVRRVDGARLHVEARYTQVNRAKKQELIESLEVFCTDNELASLVEETQSKPKDEHGVQIGQVRYVTNTGPFKYTVKEGDVFVVQEQDGKDQFIISFHDKEKGWDNGCWAMTPNSIKEKSKVLKLKKDIPIPVINLALEEARINDEDINDVLECIQVGNLSSFMTWSSTRQGHDAWDDAHNRGDYTELLDWIKENKGGGKPEQPECKKFKKGMMVAFAVELNEGAKVDGVYVNDYMAKFSQDESAVFVINCCAQLDPGEWKLSFEDIPNSDWTYHENWFKIIGENTESLPKDKEDDYPEIGSEWTYIPKNVWEYSEEFDDYENEVFTIEKKDPETEALPIVTVSNPDFRGHDANQALPNTCWNIDTLDFKKHFNPFTESKKQTKQESKTQKEMNTEKSQMKLDLGIDLNSILTTSIEQAIGSKGDKLIIEQIAPLVKKEVAKLKPTIVKVPENKDVKIEGKTHNKFKDILFLAQTERQVFLAGPSGSGKTFACSQVAEALSLPFSHISCSPGMSEAHLLGRMLFDGTYVAADFVTMYENGGVFLFDEIDAADAGTLLVINSALANGHMSVPNRKDKPIAKRHKDFVCICAGNTWGNGSIEYAGRNYMDAAFMDRFAGSKVMVDYDQDLERDICSQLGDEQGLEVFEKITNLRQACFDKKVRRVVSTRAFISAVRQIEAGKKFKNFMKDFTIDWSSEEKSKVKA